MTCHGDVGDVPLMTSDALSFAERNKKLVLLMASTVSFHTARVHCVCFVFVPACWW